MRQLPFLLLVTTLACGGPASEAGHLIAAAGPATPSAAAATPRFDGLDLTSCPNVDELRQRALDTSDGAVRDALQRWHPPAPVAQDDRAVVEALARRWVASCALDPVVELTRRLVSFPTVSVEGEPATSPAFAAMAQALSTWASERGFTFEAVGPNEAWLLGLGAGPAALAFVMHSDVVPAATTAEAEGALPHGWTRPPFDAQLADGRLYGRGTEDDKGAIAAAMVMLETLQRWGIAPRGRVLVAMGNGEESDWAGMKRLSARGPLAANVVSVDSSFPVVHGQAGFVAWQLSAPIPEPAAWPRGSVARVVELAGGQFLTQVPGDASLTLAPSPSLELADLQRSLLAAVEQTRADLATRGWRFALSASCDASLARCTARAEGEAVHSSVADEDGSNALWALAELAGRLPLEGGGATTILELVRRHFTGDHYGERLGIAYSHEAMGKLLVVPTVLRLDRGRASLAINMRRPPGRTAQEFAGALDAAVERLQRELGGGLREDREERYVGDAVLVPAEGPLVAALMEAYRAVTNDRVSTPTTIRGGTYARLFPGAVDFGPSLPGAPYRGHAPDEYIELEALRKLTQLLFEATLRVDALTPRPESTDRPMTQARR